MRADCGSCFGLCCVALPFAKSADFAYHKPAGAPCVNLLADSRCGVHSELRQCGFTGCTVYDCFGAGQKVSQVTFAGKDWRTAPETSQAMFETLPIMSHLHELLWYLTEALTLPQAGPLHVELAAVRDKSEKLTLGSAESLAGLDMGEHHNEVNALLLRVSDLVRASVPGKKKNYSGADLSGAKQRGADLAGANMRGAYLIGADLSDANLRAADMIGVDLRGADVSGADLAGSLFLTQRQINAANGDLTTKLPAALTRPTHWSAERSKTAARRPRKRRR